MAFGQSSGPPAHARQLEELAGLLRDAGHADFRDARGPLGFNQRQAAGRFTRTEADEFIDQLRRQADDGAPASGGVTGRKAPAVPSPARTASTPSRGPTAAAGPSARGLRSLPAELLAGELQRRGWMVIEPIAPLDDAP